jgi:superfamily II DNA or RNA helicase
MELRFVMNNRLLEVTKASSDELDMLTAIATVTGESYAGNKRKKWTKCYFHNYRWLPGGFWYKVVSLKMKGYNVKILNLAEFVNPIELDSIVEWAATVPLQEKYIPRWYQLRGVWLALKYRISRGEFATSAGKSLILYLLCRYLYEHSKITDGHKILIVVPSIMLVNQMHGDFADYQTDGFLAVDRIFGGSKRDKTANIVVGNIDSLVNYDSEFFEQFDAVLFDEAHKLKTSQYNQVLSFMTENVFSCIYSVSGTFYGPKDPEEFQAESISGPILMRVGAKELMDEGSIAKARIRQIRFVYGQLTSEMYYNHPDCQSIGYRQHFETSYIKDLAQRRALIAKLCDKIEFNQLLLFRSKAHCKMYHSMLTEMLPDKQITMIHGDINSQERERIKAVTEANYNVIICATYTTMSTGVSIKNLSTLHLIDSSKSFIWVRQSIGRTLRLHPSKDCALIMDYVDVFKRWSDDWLGPKQGNIAAKHGKHRKKIYAQQRFDYEEKTIDMP